MEKGKNYLEAVLYAREMKSEKETLRSEKYPIAMRRKKIHR